MFPFSPYFFFYYFFVVVIIGTACWIPSPSHPFFYYDFKLHWFTVCTPSWGKVKKGEMKMCVCVSLLPVLLLNKSHNLILTRYPPKSPPQSSDCSELTVNTLHIHHQTAGPPPARGIKLQIWLQAPFGSVAEAQRAWLSRLITMPSMRWCFTPQKSPSTPCTGTCLFRALFSQCCFCSLLPCWRPWSCSKELLV